MTTPATPTPTPTDAVPYDLLIRGGHLLDPAAGVDAPRDVAIVGDRVAAVGPAIDPALAREVVDASGLFVTPGWIDLHVHVYPWVSHFGVDPDVHCLPNGATTVLDAGTAGSLTFEGLRRFVIDRAATRVYALVHISGLGLVPGENTRPAFGEAHDPIFLSVEGAVEAAERHADVVLGIKVRLMRSISDNGRHEREALRRAREAADALKKPLMLHPTASETPTKVMIDAMRPRDVFTHCYHGKSGGVLGPDGRLLPEVRAALDRGVIFDVGHGQGSFSFDVAERCLEQGLRPHTISTDLHAYNLNGPVYDLATTMTKFLALRMSLAEVVGMATAAPAAWIGRPDLGTLAPGSAADAVLAGFDEGEFLLHDTEGGSRRLDRKLAVRGVIKAGRLVRGATRAPRDTIRG